MSNPDKRGPALKTRSDPARQQAANLPDNVVDAGVTSPVPADRFTAQQRVKNLAEAGRRLSNNVSLAQQAEMRRARAELQVEGLVAWDVMCSDSYTYNYEIFHGRDNMEFRAYQVTPEELEQPFVPAPSFDELTAIVHSNRLVVIRGKAGVGKASALLQALTKILPDDAPILRLEPGTDLTSLSCKQLPHGAALVLYDLSGCTAAQLDSFTVERLAAELEQHQCRLGLTVDEDVMLHLTDRLAVAELSAGPTPQQVFDKHLAALLVSAPAARARLFDNVEVQKLLEEQLAGSAALSQVARLAEALSRAKDDLVTAAATVRARLNGQVFEECIQWFRDLRGLRAHCMAIALAVLNGLPRETVSSAADRLETLIAPLLNRVVPAPVVDPFDPGTSVPLSVLRAEVTAGVASTAKTDVPIMVLRFVHSGYPAWVLRHVWREHDSARSAVVTWLGELGGHSDPNVRVRTATAVGVLSLEAFEFLYSQIIGVWAQDANPDIRDSAAIALGLPASDTRFQNAVHAIVQDWSTDSGALQATAARILGENAGLARPSNSLRQLAALAEVDDINVAIAIATSLGEMVMQGTVALVGRVLSEVNGWIHQANRERRLVGRLAFLQMTHLRGAPTALRERSESNESLPTLMLLTISHRRLLNQLAWLWADGLNSADVHTWIADSLTEWAGAVEPHLKARTMFIDLMRASSVDRRTGAILARAAAKWATDSGSAPKTAESLLGNMTGVTTHG